jgi:hypothetical protein
MVGRKADAKHSEAKQINPLCWNKTSLAILLVCFIDRRPVGSLRVCFEPLVDQSFPVMIIRGVVRGLGLAFCDVGERAY